MRITKVIILISTLFFVFSCDFKFMPEKKGVPEPLPPVAWADELFEAELQEDGKTKTIFKLNDTKYWTTEGSTIWTVWGEVEPFRERTVSMSKSDGYTSGGYGIVFCHDEYEVEGKKASAMLLVMINNEGQFITGKAIDSVFTPYGWWKDTPYLLRVAGSINTIKVLYDDDKNEYCLEINGHEVDRFLDTTSPVLRDGRNGYVVVVTPYDNFPITGVDVYFIEEQ